MLDHAAIPGRHAIALRKDDLYETPEWVTEALLPHLPDSSLDIWEPACGSGKMARALSEGTPHIVKATDIKSGTDFLCQDIRTQWIITNPPYKMAVEFIEHALLLADHVAMLLRTDFDHAKTRQYLFGDAVGLFAKKIVLTKRIRWFEDSKGSPSFNHAWFIWSHAHKGPPTLAYGP